VLPFPVLVKKKKIHVWYQETHRRCITLMNLELLGNREQLKSHWTINRIFPSKGQRDRFSVSWVREKGCRPFLKKLCLFLDWKVKESWREASSEKEFHGVKVILGQRVLGESHMKESCLLSGYLMILQLAYLQWVLEWDSVSTNK